MMAKVHFTKGLRLFNAKHIQIGIKIEKALEFN